MIADREVNFRRIEIINQMDLQTVNIFELDFKLMHLNSMSNANVVRVNSLSHMHIH